MNYQVIKKIEIQFKVTKKWMKNLILICTNSKIIMSSSINSIAAITTQCTLPHLIIKIIIMVIIMDSNYTKQNFKRKHQIYEILCRI